MNKYVWVASVVWRTDVSSTLGAYSTEENAKDACVAFASNESVDGTEEIEWQNYFDVLFIGYSGSNKHIVEGFELDAS